MKSIKEKANEYEKDYLFNPLAQRTPNTHFEAGANYVLDEIDKVLQGDLNSHSAFKLKTIKQIVEELKSNQ
jgi:hypothetical protein